MSRKESWVGDENDLARDPRYAVRRATLDQQFQALPAVGTPAYWADLERTGEGALPLEVLVRCLRARLAAGASGDVDRLFAALLTRIGAALQWRARKEIAHYEAAQQMQLAPDIEAECYLELWRKLKDAKQTFLEENFMGCLEFMWRHAVHAILEREGIWQRPGVTHATRVPRQEMDALAAGKPRPDGGEEMPLEPADTVSVDPAEAVEQRVDLEAAIAELTPEQHQILYDLFWRDLPQKEVAERLGTTNRTVYNRLKTILARLRAALDADAERPGGEEEDEDGR